MQQPFGDELIACIVHREICVTRRIDIHVDYATANYRNSGGMTPLKAAIMAYGASEFDAIASWLTGCGAEIDSDAVDFAKRFPFKMVDSAGCTIATKLEIWRNRQAFQQSFPQAKRPRASSKRGKYI